MDDERLQLLTVGVIADQLNQPVTRIARLIRSLRIKPSAWAGNSRLFEWDDLPRIKAEIERIDANRAAREAANNDR